MQQHVVRTMTILFHYCNLDGRKKKRRGQWTVNEWKTTTDPGGGGGLPLESGTTPGPGTQGGGAVSTVSPQQTITDDVFQTDEPSGGGPCSSSPGVWTECAQRTMIEDMHIQQCPHDDDLEIQPRVDTIRRLEDGMPAKRIVSPYTPMPVPPADGPQLGPWQVAVVRVEKTPRERLPEWNPPMLQRIGEGPLIYLKLLEMMVQF